MSLRSILQPRVTEMMTSPHTRDVRRKVVERVRSLRRRPHLVHYFHQVDDPYSHLAAQLLAPLLERYAIELDVHLVGPPPDSAAPDRERLVAYARLDAARIARDRALSFPHPSAQGAPALVERATRVLAGASGARVFATLAPRVGEAVWTGDMTTLEVLAREAGVSSVDIAATVARGNALREKLGHYLGGVFHYGGENYWGVDRLGYLEQRLIELGARRENGFALLAPRIDVQGDAFDASRAGLTLEFFPSLRSPYSYISMPRTFELAARTGVTLKIRPVLPMVMRGMAVPKAKRIYIMLDAKREAESVGVAFGRICDPLGAPVERGFSSYAFAVSKGRAGEFLHAFCRAAFAEGVDTGTDDGFRHVVTRAGLSWDEACRNVDRDGWRSELEANRRDMLAMGLWGVPSYRLRGGVGQEDFCTWGQDRLRQVEDEIRRRSLLSPAVLER